MPRAPRAGAAGCSHQGATQAVLAHDWPGNVRELGNRIRRGALMADGQLVTTADLELLEGPPPADDNLDLRAIRLRAERGALERALVRSSGGLAAAAKLLGISRPSIYALLETHGLTAGRKRAELPWRGCCAAARRSASKRWSPPPPA